MKYLEAQGKHQALFDQLLTLVPTEDRKVKNANGNPALERFRKAVRCSREMFVETDLFSAKSFVKVFMMPIRDVVKKDGEYPKAFLNKYNEKMDQIVMNAALEQNLIKEKQ